MSDTPSPSLFDQSPTGGPGSGADGEQSAGAASVAPVSGATASDAPSGQGLLADGKAADALRTIGEVAKALGIRQHVLRYWEEQFPMLRPLKRSGSRRYYRPEDIALVQRIDRLVHKEGYTLRGARLALQGRGAEAADERVVTATVAAAEAPAAAGSPVALARLRAIRARLAAAIA